jgi:hypothetical protein
MLYGAQYFLDKAEETLAIGEAMRNRAARRVMMDIVAQYIEIAAQARSSAADPGQTDEGEGWRPARAASKASAPGAAGNPAGTLAIAPSATAVFDFNTNPPVGVVIGQAYTGPVTRPQSDYVTTTNENLIIVTATPNWFTLSCSAHNAIAVNTGIKVLNGATEEVALTRLRTGITELAALWFDFTRANTGQLGYLDGCSSLLSFAGHPLCMLLSIAENRLEITHEPSARHRALNQNAASVQWVIFPAHQIEFCKTIQCTGDGWLGHIEPGRQSPDCLGFRLEIASQHHTHLAGGQVGTVTTDQRDYGLAENVYLLIDRLGGHR